MKTQRQLFRQLAAAMLLLALFWSGAMAATAPVTVYYFHSTARCAECLQIEQMVGEILRESFPRELAAGQLVWRPVNADLPENTHFVFNYDLAANELVVVRTPAASPGDYKKLSEVWNLVHEPGQFRTKLVQMVTQVLAKTD